MLFFSKNKYISKCAILLFAVSLSSVVFNINNTHASELSAFLHGILILVRMAEIF